MWKAHLWGFTFGAGDEIIVKEGNIIFKDKIIGYIERSAAPDATQSR
jgi:hypothetical protein